MTPNRLRGRVNCKNRELLEAMRVERSLASDTPAAPRAEGPSVVSRLVSLVLRRG